MRDALARPAVADIGDAILADILAEDEKAANVINGIRRNIIAKMGLRDQFLEELAALLDSLGTADDEPDDPEGEDEEETQAPRTRMAAAMTAYMRNLRSQARARSAVAHWGEQLERGVLRNGSAIARYRKPTSAKSAKASRFRRHCAVSQAR
jgi:hypothetical protein